VGIIYTLMSLCLVMMVPYDQLDPAASFATAFTQVGLPWGQYLVALGAVLGIITGVLVRLWKLFHPPCNRKTGFHQLWMVASIAVQHLQLCQFTC
jgi:amino acid transporter